MERANTMGKRNEVEQLVSSERRGMLQYASYRLGSRDDAEDAVQDVFLHLQQRLADGMEIKNLRAYLYRSLLNLCTSRERQENTLVMFPPECLPDTAETATGALEREDFEYEFRRVRLLLASIPDEQAEVIRLRFYGDRSFQEIADILGVPLTTAKSRFIYGLEKIRRGMHVTSHV